MYQCSTEAKKGRVNSSTRGEAPSGGIEKFPKSHERHIPIPPRVEKYPHEWVTKSPRVAKPRVVNLLAMSGDILPRVVELGCALSDEWGI